MQLQEEINLKRLKQETEFNKVFIENNLFFLDNIEELQQSLTEQIETAEQALEFYNLPKIKNHTQKLWEQLAESIAQGEQEKTIGSICEIFNTYACIADELDEERKLVLESKNNWFKFSLKPELVQELTSTLDSSQKQQLSEQLESVKHPVLMEQLEFLQEKVTTENIQELQQAVAALTKLVKNFPKLGEINKLVQKTNVEVVNMIRNKGFLSSFNLSATRLAGKITFVYDGLYEFFVQDLPLILNLPDMEATKLNPDQDLLTSLGQNSKKVEEMIKGRIEPTTLSKLLQFVGSGGTKPSIGSMINLNQFAREMLELTYTEVESLTKYGQALPKPLAAPKPEQPKPGETQQPSGQEQSLPTIPPEWSNQPTTPDKLETIKKATKEDSGQMIINFRDNKGQPLPDNEMVKLLKLPKEQLVQVLDKLAEKNNTPTPPSSPPIPNAPGSTGN